MEFHDDEAFVSFVADDNYASGATVLGLSLRSSKPSRKLVLLVTDGVCSVVRDRLLHIWDELIDVEPLFTTDEENLALTQRPELGITFTKLKIWTLVQFKKCVFLDADTLILSNIDDLFDRDEISASPDIGWPDCFNSGVFVFVPSLETYASLIRFANECGSFDGGDQGLLNMYFSDWATKDISYHLPFIYNMVANVCYSYAPAYKRYGKDAKVVHFLGSVKPWHHFFDTQKSQVHIKQISSIAEGARQFIQMWWEIYSVFESCQTEPTVEVQVFNSFIQDDPSQAEEVKLIPIVSNAVREIERKSSWERGAIDFNGEDSFENIQNHLDKVINELEA